MKEFEQIELQLSNEDPEVKINAFFDAYEYGEAGIKLVAQALEDKTRKVRQSALVLLAESETEIARQTLWNYLPFSKMQCLHTIKEFRFDSFDTKGFDPDYFSIADRDNTLVAYWDITYKASGATVWNLETGEAQKDFWLMAHGFGLGKKGKIFISSYQDVIMPPQKIETQKLPDNYLEGISKMRGIDPMGFAVAKNDNPLVSVVEAIQTTKIESNGKVSVILGKLRIWNYETYSCLLDDEFENLVLPQSNYFGYPIKKSTNFSIPPITFTSNTRFLIACLMNKHKNYIIKVWDIKAAKLIQTIYNLPNLAITSASVCPNGTIIACGIREGKVCAWELQTDKNIFTTDEMCPCILSNNGRVLIYATANYEIVVGDLVKEQELCRLTGHKAPIAYLTLSEDYEFIASYSTDRQIKIWGIPDYS